MDLTIDFPLGVSSAAFQIEGGWNADGKGESIWDRWLHTPGHGKGTGDVAADHYHLWEADIELLRELGVDSYRFSISWPRVLPEGRGRVNEAGLDFYRKLAARLREYGICPAVTLNHWDLPQALQDRGGWTNPETAEAFREYAKLMFDTLGSDVDIWITHNEPSVVAFMGHESGRFAPGHRDISEALAVCHHLLLAHGLAVREFREGGYPGRIGITLDYFPADPASSSEKDRLAAQRDRESHLGWFADPIFFGHYPQMMWEYYAAKGVVLPKIGAQDMALISSPIDFLGVNYYRPSIIRHCDGGSWPYDKEYLPNPSERTEASYRHCPEAFGRYLKSLNDTYHPKEILITENGISAYETPDRHGNVMDYHRIDYLYLHLRQCVLAKQSGIPVGGYYVWCFLDDLEWTGGYASRMGLVRVDYETQKRTIKESGRWYARVIQSRKLID